MPAEEPWQVRAECSGVSPDTMFPGTPAGAREVIRSFCHRCPVVVECAGAASLARERYGVWGGAWMEGSTTVQAPRPVKAPTVKRVPRVKMVRAWAAAQGITMDSTSPPPLWVRRAWTVEHQDLLEHGTRVTRVYWGCACVRCEDAAAVYAASRRSGPRSA